MEPKAQAHISAQAPRINSAGRRPSAHAKKHELNTGARIPRENEARTQRANATHRREGNEDKHKRTGARLSRS